MEYDLFQQKLNLKKRMTFTTLFITAISSLLFIKLRTISLRNNLNPMEDKRLIISASLIILFLITKVTLPYPDSLYWFIVLGVFLTSFAICYDIVKLELARFKALKVENKILNVLFYSLFIVVTHLFI